MTKKMKPGPKLRVAVAKDVIKYLSTKRFVAKHNFYIKSEELDDLLGSPTSVWDSKLQTYVTTPEAKAPVCVPKKCQVCGIGSMFLGLVGIANTITAKELGSTHADYNMIEYLEKQAGFTEEQMRLVELYFEGKKLPSSYAFDFPSTSAVKKWRKAAVKASRSTIQKNPEKILRAILNNIIRNNGTFKP